MKGKGGALFSIFLEHNTNGSMDDVEEIAKRNFENDPQYSMYESWEELPDNIKKLYITEAEIFGEVETRTTR